MRSPLLVVLLAVALALAACGGGSDEETDSATGAFDTGVIATTETPTETVPPPDVAEEAFQIDVPSSTPIGPTSPPKVVKQLQQALLLLGYKIGEADGIYGENTRKAVVAFQKKQKLKADGLVGTKTAKAINKELRQLAQQGQGG